MLVSNIFGIHLKTIGNSSQDCRVNLVYNLTNTGLDVIQKERKKRIHKVCEMCRNNRSSMECNHITFDEDYHTTLMYKNLLVDDKNKV